MKHYVSFRSKQYELKNTHVVGRKISLNLCNLNSNIVNIMFKCLKVSKQNLLYTVVPKILAFK